VAGIANLQINIDARGAIQKLREFTQGSRSAAAASQELSRGTDAAAEALGREGRQLLVTTNGLKYFIDATGRARAENSRFLSATEKVSAGIRDQGKAAESTGGKMGMFAGVLGRVAIAAAAIQAARFVIAKTSELETQTRSLQTLTGSAERAAQIISELQQLGAVTPFTSTELIDAAKRLQAFGVEAKNVVETTRRLADVSGATGAELQGLVTAYGQVQAKGRLQGEELLQFQERGISLQKELQKMYGMTGEEFQKALGKGQISAKAVEVAIIRLTSAGGKYANGAIAQSTTLAGKFSTLTDGIESIAKKIGTVLSPALKGVLDLANAAVDAINRALAGPDRKTANDQLYNINARATQLRASIGAAEKSGIGMATGVQMRGVDGQVLGGGQPALPGMRFELQQLERQAAGLKKRIGALTVSKPSTPAIAAPPALGSMVGGGAAGGGRTGGASKADKAASDRERTAQMVAESAQSEFYARRGFVISKNILSAQKENNQQLVIARETQKDLLGIARQIDDVRRNKELPVAAKMHELEALRFKAKEVTLKFAYDIGIEEEKQAKAVDERLAGLTALAEQYGKNLDLNVALTAEQEKQKILADTITSSVGQGLTTAFNGLIQGTEEFGSSLRKIASGVLVDIANQLLRIYVINQVTGLIGNLLGPQTGGFMSGTKFNPAMFAMPQLSPGLPNPTVFPWPARAMGGPVTAGQPYLVGERGPELFVPSGGGNVLPSGKGGGNVTVNVSVDATGSQVAGDNEQASQLGRVIAAAVQSELIKAKRPGGILNS
jgi:tape measure domain-containing protein